MSAFEHSLRATLGTDRLALGMGLRSIRTPDVGRLLAVADYDWAMIDLEHGSMSIDTAVQMSIACEDSGVSPLVRVPAGRTDMATRLLDGGAMGVVFPHVDTPEQAQTLVDACLYPPAGHRSMGGARLAQLGFQAHPRAEAAELGNEATFLVMMIETPLAVENATAIAAVPHVDALLIGGNDLTLEMGIPGAMDHERLRSAFETVISACQAHDVVAGMGGVYDPPLMTRYIEMGVRFVLAAGDSGIFLEGASARARDLRNAL